MSEMVKLEFKAVKLKRYNGHDPVTKNGVIAQKAGTVIEVSVEKGKQLLKDFPNDFVDVSGERKAPAAVVSPAPVAGGKGK